MNDCWQALDDELLRWGKPASLWWRDDDAVADTAALQKLISLQGADNRVPLHLACIPKLLESSLAQRINNSPDVYILQHGYNHQSNALEGERNIELGGDQSTEELLVKLGEGRHILQQAFAERYLDILVPPWNRIGPAAETAIEQLGYRAFSGLGLRGKKQYRFAQLNVHIDIIDWQQKQFIGTETCIKSITEQLYLRRLSPVDSTEPLGIMSHHLAHDSGCWEFLQALMLKTSTHTKIRWITAEQALKQ